MTDSPQSAPAEAASVPVAAETPVVTPVDAAPVPEPAGGPVPATGSGPGRSSDGRTTESDGAPDDGADASDRESEATVHTDVRAGSDTTAEVQPDSDSDTEPSLVDRIQTAVLAVPGVADLHAGVFGEAGTYLPGRKVAGIRLREDVAEVHLSVRLDRPVRDTAEQVHAAVAALVDTPVHVSVEDVVST